MARALAVVMLAAALFAVWLAWVVYEVRCEEGCLARPWPLVAQLVVACVGLVAAALAALRMVRRGIRPARGALVAVAMVYLLWALLIAV